MYPLSLSAGLWSQSRAHSHVKDGGPKGELITTHAHRLLHTKDFGVIQGSLVQVLQGLRDEE